MISVSQSTPSRGGNFFIITVSFFTTRLHERPLHFEKITFYTCMRTLKYYIISMKRILIIKFHSIKFVLLLNCLANSEE